MIKNEYTLTVDIKRKHTAIIPVFVQYDTAILRFKLFDNGIPFNFTGNETIKTYHKRSDGFVVEGTAELASNQQVVEYQYLGNEMSCLGFVETSLAIYLDDKKVSVQPFKVEIVKNLEDEAASPSNPEYGALQSLIVQVESLVSRAVNAIEDVEQVTEDWRYADSYDASKSYAKYNVVSYNGSSYIAKQDNKGRVPLEGFSNEYWGLIARKGEDGEGLVVLHKDAFVTVEGQTEFTLSGEYDLHQNRIRVIVDGVEQFSPKNFLEQSSNKFMMNEPLPAGTDVTAIYFGQAPAIVNDLQLQITNINNVLEYLDLVTIQEIVAQAEYQGNRAKEEADKATIKLSEMDTTIAVAKTAANNANDKASLAEQKANLADGSALNADEKASLANAAASRANTVSSSLEDTLPLIEGWESKGEYSSSTQYVKNNIVTYDGSSYQALQDTVENPPTDSTHWSIVARRGVDGEGSVSFVNEKSPDEEGNIQLTSDDIGALSSEGGILGGDLIVSNGANIIPEVPNGSTLGSPEVPFADVYIGPNSLYVDGKKVISSIRDTLDIATSNNQHLVVNTSGLGTTRIASEKEVILYASQLLNIQSKGDVSTLSSGRLKFETDENGQDIVFETKSELGNINLVSKNNTNIKAPSINMSTRPKIGNAENGYSDVLLASDKGIANGLASLDADGNVLDGSGNKVEGRVTSVNGQIGDVVINNSHADEMIYESEVHGMRWDGRSLEIFDGDVWNQASGKYTQLVENFVATEETSIIPIENSFSEETDFISVFYEGIKLDKDENFKISSDSQSVELMEWTIGGGERIRIEVFKNVSDTDKLVSGSQLNDYSVEKSKLSHSLQEEIDEKAGQQDLTAIENSVSAIDNKVDSLGQSFSTHQADKVSHITAQERDAWDSKQNTLPEERIRKITFGTAEPTGGEHGDIYFQYE